MATQSGSGFDAAKFQKLVAMFDSPYSEEAATAFKLALGELKKNQVRFCDRLVDSDEANRAKEECARVRAELKQVLDRCTRRDAQTEELQDIIDRLHERIALMEEEAAASDEAVSIEDDKPEPPERSYTPPPFVDHGPPNPLPPPYFPESPLPSLPLWKAAFWIGLMESVVGYVFLVVCAGHLLTLDEWNDIGCWFALYLVGGGLCLYMAGRKHGFSQTRFGQLCGEKLALADAMLVTVAVVLALWVLAYVRNENWPIHDSGPVPAGVSAALGVVWLLRGIRSHRSKFGLEGLSVKLGVVIIGVFAAFWVGYQTIPWAITHDSVMLQPVYFWVLLLVVVLALSSDNFMQEVMTEENVGGWILTVALVLAVWTVVAFGHVEHKPIPAPRQAQHRKAKPAKPAQAGSSVTRAGTF